MSHKLIPEKAGDLREAELGATFRFHTFSALSNLWQPLGAPDELCVRLPASPLSPGTRLYPTGTQMCGTATDCAGFLDSATSPNTGLLKGRTIQVKLRKELTSDSQYV